MSALGETLRTLRARGFAPVAAKSPVRAFKGVLACKKGVSVRPTHLAIVGDAIRWAEIG